MRQGVRVFGGTLQSRCGEMPLKLPFCFTAERSESGDSVEGNTANIANTRWLPAQAIDNMLVSVHTGVGIPTASTGDLWGREQDRSGAGLQLRVTSNVRTIPLGH